MSFTGSGENGEWVSERPEGEITKKTRQQELVEPLPEEKQGENKINAVEPDILEKPDQTEITDPSETPDPTENEHSAKAPTEWPNSIPYSIHVNSFPTIEEAESRIQELTDLGYECFMVYAEVSGKGSYYRIFVGSFSDFSSAQTTCEDYKNRKEFADDIHPVTRQWAFMGYKG